MMAEVGWRFGRIIEGGDGGARSYIHALDLGKFCGDFIGHAIAEVNAVGFGAEVLEWEDGDGRSGGDSGGVARIFAIPRNSCDGQERNEADSDGV